MLGGSMGGSPFQVLPIWESFHSHHGSSTVEVVDGK